MYALSALDVAAVACRDRYVQDVLLVWARGHARERHRTQAAGRARPIPGTGVATGRLVRVTQQACGSPVKEANTLSAPLASGNTGQVIDTLLDAVGIGVTHRVEVTT